MKSVPKLIRRFMGILLISIALLIILNVGMAVIISLSLIPNAQPWKTAAAVGEGLQQTDNNEYVLSQEITLELKKHNAWAIFIDNSSLQVVWQSDNLPHTVPMSYTVSDIANLTRGYIDGYPAFTGEAENGLVVVGYPKDSFWKHMWPGWDYHLIANAPYIFCLVLLMNAILLLIIYVVTNTKLLKSVKPITIGIQALSTGEPVHTKEKGLLSELAVNINRTSEILQSQNYQLRKKETARANWIAGVSHDIRTPLSMVMGYAGQLKDNAGLTEEERQKAAVIVKQSERMRNLINDLNLASKLEYNMQPIHPVRQNMIAIVRQVVVDFINMSMDDKHLIEWKTEESLTSCPVNADKDLLKRAISNLIQNSIKHNEQGCKIYVSVTAEVGKCNVAVADNGTGATDEQIERLNNMPHYMVCDENITEQRHGLGLLIVRQIIAAHGGTTTISRSIYGGFAAELTLPMEDEKQGQRSL